MKKFGIIVAGLLFVVVNISAGEPDYTQFETANEALAYFACDGIGQYNPEKGSLQEGMADALGAAINGCN